MTPPSGVGYEFLLYSLQGGKAYEFCENYGSKECSNLDEWKEMLKQAVNFEKTLNELKKLTVIKLHKSLTELPVKELD